MNPSCHPHSTRSILGCAFSLGIITSILVLVNVVMSARVAQDGLAIDDLAHQQTSLNSEIVQLEQRLLDQNSLADLSVKAVQLGYQPPEANLTVTANFPVAYNLSHE